MKAKRKLKEKSPTITNDNNEKINIKCFINHSLSTKRRKLYKECLIVKKNFNIKYLWIINGTIYMRKDDHSMKKNITDTSDLDSFKS